MRTKTPFDEKTLALWRTQIDRSIPTPLYYQLKVIIKNAIDSGSLTPGMSIPTENELCIALNFSRPPIRQCMQELVNEGYIVRYRGKGSFVSQPKMELNFITKHESFHEIIEKNGYMPTTKVLDFALIDPIPQINEILKIKESESLYYLRRLCLANEIPLLYTESYTQASKFPGLLQYDFSKTSLYATMDSVYESPVVQVKRVIGASDASQADASMLRISKGHAIFVVTNLGFDPDGNPIEYSNSRYRTENIKFTNYMQC